MKENLIILSAVCMATAASANSYNLLNDWTWGQPNNPNAAWSVGSRNESTPGNFDPFVLSTSHAVDTIVPGWDFWSNPAINNTMNVFFTTTWSGWSFPAPNVILNAWTSYCPDVELKPAAGTYSLSALFKTGGYATPTSDFPDTRIYVTLNGNNFLLTDELFGFSGVTPGNNGSSLNQQITIAAGDYLDFFIAGNPEARSSLAVSLTPIPEPATLGFLGLAGLFVILRRRK
jgi:hypothetical protein